MLELGAFVALGLLAAVGLTCLVELVAGGMLRESRRMVTVVLATADCRGSGGSCGRWTWSGRTGW